MSSNAEVMDSTPQTERQTRYLYWWLLAALFFEYARPGSFIPGVGAAKLNTLLPVGLLAVAVFAKGLRPAKEIFGDTLAKWMCVYLGLIFLSLLHADVTLYSFDVFKGTLGYFFFFFLIGRIVTSPQRLRGVFMTLITAHLVLLALNPAVVLDPTARHYINGATFLGDGNDFSLSLCILLPLAIELGLAARSKWARLMLFALAGVLLLAVIGTASRGASLALVAVTAYLWWRCPRKLLTLFVISFVVLCVLAYASDLYIERMSTLTNVEEESSAMGRIMAWKAGVRMAIDNPILGVGTGHYAVSFGTDYRPPDVDGPVPWLTAHSMYFLVLGELGLPGIITLLVLVIGNIRANTRLQRSFSAGVDTHPTLREMNRILLLMSAGMVGFGVAGAFLSVSYYPHVFVMTGLFVAARRVTALRMSECGIVVGQRRKVSRHGVRYSPAGGPTARGDAR